MDSGIGNQKKNNAQEEQSRMNCANNLSEIKKMSRLSEIIIKNQNKEKKYTRRTK